MNIQHFEIAARKLIESTEHERQLGDHMGETTFLRGMIHGMRMMLRLIQEHLHQRKVA